VKLSIDDFGTGYSSLSYLRRFPVDTLKIDQSFVAAMDAENYAIVKTIIGLARNLELNVVAEGVETTKQHRLLALAGCGSAQDTCLRNPCRRRVSAFSLSPNGDAPDKLNREPWHARQRDFDTSKS